MSAHTGDFPMSEDGKSAVDPSVRIALQGLVSARWVFLLILVALGIGGALIPSLETSAVGWVGKDSNVLAIVATVLAWAASNVVTWKYSHSLSKWGKQVAGLHLVTDIVALTILLGLTGGASNPFTVLFVVPITLSTQVSPRWTWGIAICSVIAFGILLEVVPVDAPAMDHSKMNHGDGGHYGDHLRGMWLSLGLAGALITVFVHRIALRMAQQRDELTALREVARMDRELARIGSLAAGAAHELGTPLATLTVLAGELPHMQQDEQAEAIVTMRSELLRCKRIISSMASSELRAEALGMEDIEPWRLCELFQELGEEAAAEARGDKAISFVPKAVVLGIVRELIKNAHAAGDIETVSVHGVRNPDSVVIEVKDQGKGMSESVVAAATDPFFTTKVGTENMGLGLFLVRSQLRPYGGHLSISSKEGEGSCVQISIPDAEPEREQR